MTTNNQQVTYSWAVIGAGPAGIATVGSLIDHGVKPEQILWLDPDFQCGDFGQKWCAVSSNTSVGLFLEFLHGIKSFEYSSCEVEFELDRLDPDGFCKLGEVAKPLDWVTQNLKSKVHTKIGLVKALFCAESAWNLMCEDGQQFKADRVVLATGASPRSLQHDHIQEVKLPIALTPEKLKQQVDRNDTVAVFGSSHSAMIIIKNLIEAGIKEVHNYYLTPLRYAIKMDGWTLYDNTGLKGETAQWTRENISKRLHPQVKRFQSSPENIQQHLKEANKAVYAIGFQQRGPVVQEGVDCNTYDTSNGIIAPGLMGAGIGFPRKITDPNGNQELNVGLWKFMQDIKSMIPIWSQYGL